MLALAWLTGMAMGAAFFWGLWWTVRRGLASPRPALWFATSLVVRMAIMVGGLSLFLDDHWPRLLVFLAGFTIARFAVTWLTRPSAYGITTSSRGASHATQS
jgi:F1F0 ATPase subunit 2